MKHVLLISRALIPSVSLCGHSQLSLLAEQGKIEYRWCSTLRVRRKDISWADALVFVRSDDDVSLHLAETANRLGKTCLYVLDDDLLNIPEGLDSSAHYGREETKELIRKNMAACSVFLSPSRNLLAKYGEGFARCVRIEEPTTVCPVRERPDTDKIRIGFAGSIDRTGDINALLSGALRRILRDFGDRVTVEFFGAKPAVAEELGLRHIPYQDSYEEYVSTMASLGWDIGLAPMPDTAFHRCKHYNKYIEYASYGIAGIYSAVEPYVWAVRDGENGLLCENTEEAWYNAIARLIEDASLRKHISAECLREAEEVYSLAETARVWEDVIETCPEAVNRPGALLRFDLENALHKVRWVFRKLKAWGWRAPVKIWEKLFRKRSVNTKRKPAKSFALILLIYLAAAAVFYCLGGDQLFVKTVAGEASVMPERVTPELTSDVELRQPFSVEADRLELVYLTAASYGRETEGTLSVSILRGNGETAAEADVPVSALEDGRAVPIRLNALGSIVPGERLMLSVTADSAPGSAVSLYYGSSLSAVKGSVVKEIGADERLTVNGETMDGVLCFQTSGSRELMFGRIYWYIFGGMGILLMVFLLFVWRQQRLGRATLFLKLLDVLDRYRFLLQQLVSRDFKTKYKRSVLGMLWSFLNPLLMMLIYYVVFSTLFHSDIENFPVYLIIGIVCFNFFGEATNMALQSIVGNAALITKVYVPKYIYPASRVASSTVNLLLSLIPLLIVMIITGIRFRLQFLLIVFGLSCLILLALGVGMLLAAAMVFFRDTQFLWGVLLTMLNFLTPIFYPESIIPAKFATIFKLNPLYHIIRFNRIVLMDGISPEPKAYLFCLVLTAVPLLLGLAVFKKTQDRFVLHI